MKKHLFIIPLLFFVLNTLGQNLVKYSLKNANQSSLLTEEKILFTESLLDPSELLIVDSLLFILNDGTDYAVDILNINTGKKLASFCKRGRGPGELIFPFKIQFLKDTQEIMVNDLNGKKVVYFSLASILKDEPQKYTKTMPITKVYLRKILQVKNQRFFCNLLGHQDGYMNCILEKEGDINKFTNTYPEIKQKYNPVLGSNIFGINLGVSPNLEHIVAPYSYWDRIDVFDSNGNFKLILEGPNYTNLDVKVSNGIGRITNKNKQAFGLPAVGNTSFIVPYSGKLQTESYGLFDHLFQFDYSGRLLNDYKLNIPVSYIAVDWAKAFIYAIHFSPEPTVYRFRF